MIRYTYGINLKSMEMYSRVFNDYQYDIDNEARWDIDRGEDEWEIWAESDQSINAARLLVVDKVDKLKKVVMEACRLVNLS